MYERLSRPMLLTITGCAALAGAGCASSGGDGPPSQPVSKAYRYTLIDTGANPPGKVGLGDDDYHFYPYVYAPPTGGVSVAHADDPWLNSGAVWVYPGVIYGSAGYPTGRVSTGGGSVSGASGTPASAASPRAPSRPAPRMATESRRPAPSAPQRPNTPGQVQNSRR